MVDYSRSLDENTKNRRHLAAEFLTGETDQVGTRNHGNVGQDEDGEVVLGEGIADGDSSGNERPEDVDGGGGFAGRTAGNLEEVQRVEATATRLTSGLDSTGQCRVAVAVIVFVLDRLVLGKRRVLRGGLGGLFVGHGAVDVAVEDRLARAS